MASLYGVADFESIAKLLNDDELDILGRVDVVYPEREVSEIHVVVFFSYIEIFSQSNA